MRWFLALFLVYLGALGSADGSYQGLFIIERSTNANVVHYDAKIGSDGSFDPKEPVVVYWVMAAEGGGHQNLSAAEKRLAYGFTIRRDSRDQSYWMTLVSQTRREIHIYQEGGKVRAAMLIGGREAYLRKIYVQARKTSWRRTVDYVELFGEDIVSGRDCYEKVAPEH